MNEFFYGTPPQDTQDFSQVLRGVGRSIQDIGRGVSYYPYDLVGAPVDLINMALTPVGLGSERPVLGSDYLRNIAQSLGLAQPSTGSGTETAARFASALINPAAGARAVGKVGSDINRLISMIDETPPRGSIDFSPRQVSSAQQVAQEIMQPKRSDIGFYSQLEAATFPMQDKGTGDQFLAQIQKTAGVKPEEIKYTGLDDFLKGKKSVTKTEIQDYLNANRVDVQEVRLGGKQDFDLTRLSQLEDEVAMLRQHPIDDPNFGEDKYDEMIRLMNIRDQSTTSDLYKQADDAMMYGQRAQARGDQRSAENFFRQYELLNTRAEKLDLQGLGMTNLPKFSQHKLPGGENYREILLTLPERKPNTEALARLEDATKAYKQNASYENYQALNNARLEVGADWDKMPSAQFKSSHFDQPNILAHMRVNDRVVDGKKTLFIEEIQSDWHQAGRKKGYQSKDIESQLKVLEKSTEKRYREIRQLSNEMTALDDTQLDQFNALAAERQRLLNLQDEETDSWKRLYDAGRENVPDAPFKTSWHELTLKRAIQEASEKGYDQIAFTTGKTQVERYPEALRQVADDISWSNIDESGRKYVDIKKDGNIVLQVSVDQSGKIYQSSIQDAYGKTLDEFVGKPMAQRVTSESQGTIKGQDFTVGGKGMEGFYDNILPKSLEKLGKKFDAKVGKTEMDGVEVWQMDITPKMRESVTTKGQPLFAVPAVGAGLLGAGMSQDEQMF
jgi:hypothetical protein